MKKNVLALVLAASSLLAVSCGSNNASSSSYNPPVSSSEPAEFKASRAFRYLQFDLEELAEQKDGGWYYEPTESLDYDVYADMVNLTTNEETGEEKWVSMGIGLDIEEATLLLNGRDSNTAKGLTAELDLDKCKLWMVNDNFPAYQKVPHITGYYNGADESAYLDLSDASLLRMAIVQLVNQMYGSEEPEEPIEGEEPTEVEKWNLASRTRIPLHEREKFFINLLSPLTNRSDALYKRLVSRIKEIYGENGTDYCYFDNERVKDGFYLNWEINDFEELSNMLTDILTNSGYSGMISDAVKDEFTAFGETLESFKLDAGISWTQDELRSISLTLEARFDEDKVKANLEEDATSYIKYIGAEGKFMPIFEKAAKITLPDLSKFVDMEPIPGMEEDENDEYFKILNDLLTRGDNTPEWTWPDLGDDEDWGENIRDWLSSIRG